ncbi:MAG: methyltransferase domain-containing protein [Thermodesulfobacteriota bacterium]
MDRIKTRIKDSFTRNAGNYDLYASVQRDVASMLLKRSFPFFPEEGKALDLGCGTGFITLPLAKMGIAATGIDLSSGMIDVLRSKAKREGLNHYLLSVADGDDLPFKDGQFDIAISNLMYQWIWSLKDGFQEVSRVMGEGGYFLFSLLGEASLRELKEVYVEAATEQGRNGLSPLITFPKAEGIKKALRKTGFKDVEVENLLLTRYYSNLLHLLRTLKNIGAGNPFQGEDKSFNKRTVLDIMNRIYQERFSKNGRVKATYEVIFCSGRKRSFF